MTITMVASVDQYIAGELYDIPSEKADDFILKGYATGSLSREYSPSEKADKLALNQIAGM